MLREAWWVGCGALSWGVGVRAVMVFKESRGRGFNDVEENALSSRRVALLSLHHTYDIAYRVIMADS